MSNYTNPTPQYGWTMPTEDGSTNDWGRLLNDLIGGTVAEGASVEGIDSVLAAVSAVANAAMPLAGGTFTGDVILGTGARLSETVKTFDTLDADWSAGNFFTKTLGHGSNALTFSNYPASGKIQFITIELTQPSGGDGTVSWPSEVKWSEGTAPTLSTTTAYKDVLIFFTRDGGSNVYGAHSMQDMEAAS